MKTWKPALIVFLSVLLMLLLGCENAAKSADAKDFLKNIQKESRILKPTGFVPEMKTAELANYFNRKWPGYVHIAAQYSFNPQIMTDKLTIMVMFMREDEQFSPDEVIGEIVWNAAREIQAVTTEIIHEKQDGSTDIYQFTANGAAIRKDAPQNWRNHISQEFSGAITFPSDEPSSYKVIGLPKHDNLKKMVDDWNEIWAGKVRIIANDVLTESGSIQKIKYRVLLGFEIPTNEGENYFYRQRINNALGEIVYETYGEFSPQEFLMFVSLPDGTRYAYYPKSGEAIAELQNLILAGYSKEIVIQKWSDYFISKPYGLQGATN